MQTPFPSDWGYYVYTAYWMYTQLQSCPANAKSKVDSSGAATCRCNPNYLPNGAGTACVPMVLPDGPAKRPRVCTGDPHFGDPIYPLSGTERYVLDLGPSFGPQALSAVYDSIRKAPVVSAGTELTDMEPGAFGELWDSSLHKRLVFSAGNLGARASRGGGRTVSFMRNSSGSGSFVTDSGSTDQLLTTANGYRYIDAASRAQETYDSQGVLSRVDRADGKSLVYGYSTASTPVAAAPGAGYLLSVTDPFARAVTFEYDGAGRIAKVTNFAGQDIALMYDAAGNLSRATWPDGHQRTFLYENASFPWALTGITSENAARYSTISYDAEGRATAVELAGGVDRHTVSYTQPPRVQVNDTYDATANTVFRTRTWQAPNTPVVAMPTGGSLTFGVGNAGNTPGITSQSQPAGSGCTASTSNQSYDANGNVSQRDDFNGKRTCYANDLSRNLETVKVEGLATSATCGPLITAVAALPAGSRKVSTQWHPDWRLETKVAEPGRITTKVYNGQPDPFNGNAVASCAPSTALLPDGKPIVVLCKQVEQATTDANGASGLSATLQAGVANRVTTWTYNAFGQVLTEDGPRTDISDVTTYTYYATTTADYTKGDLQTVTNAAGKVTTFTKYNKHGQLLQSTDPNGVVTVNTYDLRQRLKSTSIAGQATSYDYDAVGQLKKVTQPDGSWLGYDYDDAHRQTAMYDNLGNRVEYTLDNAGNKTAEAVKNNAAVLKRQLNRSMDALGRVQQTTGRE